MFLLSSFVDLSKLLAGETEEKSYRVIKEGGTFAHILNTGTDQDRIAAGQKGVRNELSCVTVTSTSQWP